MWTFEQGLFDCRLDMAGPKSTNFRYSEQKRSPRKLELEEKLLGQDCSDRECAPRMLGLGGSRTGWTWSFIGKRIDREGAETGAS